MLHPWIPAILNRNQDTLSVHSNKMAERLRTRQLRIRELPKALTHPELVGIEIPGPCLAICAQAK